MRVDSHLTSRGSFSHCFFCRMQHIWVQLIGFSGAHQRHLPSGSLERNEHVSAEDPIYLFIFCREKLDVCSSVNRQKSVSHSETVRVGNSVTYRFIKGRRRKENKS